MLTVSQRKLSHPFFSFDHFFFDHFFSITFFLHFTHTNETMNRKTNAPTEPRNIQKRVQKTQKKRTEVDNTLETEETERSNRKRTEVGNTLETEQSNKRLKTADQLTEGKYFITYYLLNICNMILINFYLLL